MLIGLFWTAKFYIEFFLLAGFLSLAEAASLFWSCSHPYLGVDVGLPGFEGVRVEGSLREGTI